MRACKYTSSFTCVKITLLLYPAKTTLGLLQRSFEKRNETFSDKNQKKTSRKCICNQLGYRFPYELITTQ